MLMYYSGGNEMNEGIFCNLIMFINVKIKVALEMHMSLEMFWGIYYLDGS